MSRRTRRGPDKQDDSFKLILFGASGVGKTGLLDRFLRREFDTNFDTTRTFTLDSGTVKLQLQDTPGGEEYRELSIKLLRGANGIFMIYDISNRETFEKVKHSLAEVRKGADKDVLITLVGNKSDLEDSRVVSTEEARAFAREENLGFVETSALNGENVEDIFADSAHELLWKKNLPVVREVVGEHIQKYKARVNKRGFSFYRRPLTENRKESIKAITALIDKARSADEFSRKFQDLIKQVKADHCANNYLARLGIMKSKLHEEMEVAHDDLVEEGILPGIFPRLDFRLPEIPPLLLSSSLFSYSSNLEPLPEYDFRAGFFVVEEACHPDSLFALGSGPLLADVVSNHTADGRLLADTVNNQQQDNSEMYLGV